MAEPKTDDLYGYEQTDEIEYGGKYLSFRRGDKGRVITIRLAGKPKYVNQHWIIQSNGKESPITCKGEDCPYCGKAVPPKEKLPKVAKWGWIVLDRADGEAKIFTGPTLIARKIRELVENPRWGNPFLYDIEIKRVEDPGAGYYAVTPIPDGKGEPLTADQQKKIDGSGLDLAAELIGGKDSKHVGNYGASEMETAPDTNVTPKDDPIVGEDPGDNLPF